jgi:hypothetical protein
MSWRRLGAGPGGGRMEIRISEEDYEKLKHIAGKRELSDEDMKLLKLVLQKMGVVLNLKEFVAIRYDDGVKILCLGMVVTISFDIYEGSIVLGFEVENQLNFSALSVEVFPERRDELRDFLNRIKSGRYQLDKHT